MKTDKSSSDKRFSSKPKRPVTKKDNKKMVSDDEGASEGTGERLNVFLQSRGIASRRKADDLIMLGRVKVNGTVVKQHGTRVMPSDTVAVDDKLVTNVVPKIVLMFHKPDMCITGRNDPEGRRTIFDLPNLKHLPKNVQSVGRLDFRSEGMLLLTNDGDLAYALTHPKFSVSKSYAVLLSDFIRPQEVDQLKKGVALDDGVAKALSVKVGSREPLGGSKSGQWVELIVTEGRNRLIRRMMEALGLKVVRLVRLAMGEIQMPFTLKPGQTLQLSNVQLEFLNTVKENLKQHRSKPQSDQSKLTPEEAQLRKQKRKRAMNKEEYAEAQQKRSIEALKKERERKGLKKPAKPATQGKENISVKRGEKPKPIGSKSKVHSRARASRNAK